MYRRYLMPNSLRVVFACLRPDRGRSARSGKAVKTLITPADPQAIEHFPVILGNLASFREETKMADRLVLYAADEKVSVITLNRPEKLNAISADLQQQLQDAFARADADAETSVVLLRAEGRSFCAGYDISARAPVQHDWRSDPTKAHDHLRVQLDFEMMPWAMKKPVIAAVQGHVMGGGCELVMLCDLTIAADNASFGEPEVRFSSVGPAIVMPMIIGHKKARELLYFGDAIDAATALELGMINRIVPLAELPEASLRWAKRLSLISPEALYATKRAINRGADAAGFRTALYAGLDVVGPLYATRTEFGQRFRDMVAAEGVPAAVRWRAAQFRD
jgi:enoyl-CoA hydratase